MELFLVAGVGFGAKDPSFVKTCFGLFAILRSDTQNDAVCCRLQTASIDPDSALRYALVRSVIERKQ